MLLNKNLKKINKSISNMFKFLFVVGDWSINKYCQKLNASSYNFTVNN